MGKPQAIRNPKKEMTSCWVCTLAVVIIYVAKTLLLGSISGSVVDYVLWALIAIWVVISIFYTIQYQKFKKKMENMNGKG